MNCVSHPYIPRADVKAMFHLLCRIISAFLAYSQLGVGYMAGVLAGQTNSTLLMPPLSERGETKVVQPSIGTDRVHIRAEMKIKILLC